MNSLMVALSALAISDRLRAVDVAEVDRLAVSMASIGQLQPIEVMHEGGRYRLIIGAHRVAAATKLGWDRIAAVVFEGDPDQVRLREIDENLYRRELSPYDQAAFLAERAQVCQRLGLIPKHARKLKGDQSANLALRTYASEIADKFGISRRDMFRSLRRRRQIADDAWALIAGTSLANKGSMLDALCDVPSDKQRSVVEAALAPVEPGEPRPSFSQLCRAASGVNERKTPPSRGRRHALSAAWDAADKDDREWFVGELSYADRLHLIRLLNGKTP